MTHTQSPLVPSTSSQSLSLLQLTEIAWFLKDFCEFLLVHEGMTVVAVLVVFEVEVSGIAVQS